LWGMIKRDYTRKKMDITFKDTSSKRGLAIGSPEP